MLCLLLAALAPAQAHPFGSNLPAHDIELVLDAGRVQVDYSVEIPTADALREVKALLGRGPRGPLQEAWLRRQREQELHDGLSLVADGAALATEALPTLLPSGKGDSRFLRYAISLGADLPLAARTLVLRNGNLPDQPALFRAQLAVTDAVVLDAASIFDLEGEAVVANREGQWRMEEENRELRLAFRPRDPRDAALHAALRRLGSEDGWVSPRQTGHAALAQVDRGGWGALGSRGRLRLALALLPLGLLVAGLSLRKRTGSMFR
jgi:hypothetical protein